ncbi:MAG: ABC transporter ATP-binding protein [Oscillospiraceae bacterium]|nr:ABC transporter ATP-binding protein [Oscillospiraceae bacterium]
MENPALSAEKLSVGYGTEILIRDISLSLYKGKIVTLIGPNGAGKSTILKTLSRQLDSMGGAVYIGKEELSRFKGEELAKKMSLVMTGRVAPELMTCAMAVETGRYPYTGRLGLLSPEDRRIAKEAMEMTAVSEIADREISRISDGQRQRVLLARAICQEPEILILDEPTSFLDIRHKLKLLSILRRLVREKGLAVIMSMHELDMAERVSDHVICVGEEGISMQGAPSEIFTGEIIGRLYGIEKGCFEEHFCTAELPPSLGEPKIFVIGGNGSGAGVFRSLQRLDIPFAAGVIHENDVDYPVARALASYVISEKPFEPISPEKEKAAMELIDKCDSVICPLESYGSVNIANERLRKYAAERSKLIDIEKLQ